MTNNWSKWTASSWSSYGPTSRLNQQYQLLLSVDGVGPVLASYLLACTEGFTRFRTVRQLACQAALHYEHTSRSSIKGRTRVSPQADQVLKTLLHMSALG
ncbi:MAG: IS110 family transposase [Flavobacteriales bacterium]|nr:IS110 family transposase [Flavobacteriales bacterium]